MGMFDYLIDAKNQKPKSDIEYIYRLNIVWTPGVLESKQIKVGTIMTNVVQLDNRSYEFTCKETGETLRTNYAWALAENTTENLARIEIYEQEYIKFKQHEKELDVLRNEIVTLQNEY